MEGDSEHIAFLSSQAQEHQGEVQKAFVHAILYKYLDPQVLTKNATFLCKLISLRYKRNTTLRIE